MPFRVGIGYDVHRFSPTVAQGNCVTICGTEIEHPHKIEAHSDGDVGIHALVDAILGCVGEDGIGKHFPNTDPQWKDKQSTHFLLEAQKRALDKGYAISNFDLIIVCERPKITPHVQKMKALLAELLQVDIATMNIKAVTTERLGFIGREEGIAAQAIVMCCRVRD